LKADVSGLQFDTNKSNLYKKSFALVRFSRGIGKRYEYYIFSVFLALFWNKWNIAKQLPWKSVTLVESDNVKVSIRQYQIVFRLETWCTSWILTYQPTPVKRQAETSVIVLISQKVSFAKRSKSNFSSYKWFKLQSMLINKMLTYFLNITFLSLNVMKRQRQDKGRAFRQRHHYLSYSLQ
jgi:hypothetical protein